eukprot:Rmarinus@m.26854
MRFVVLYTTDLTRKRKRWKDGFLLQKGKQTVLQDDSGNFVHSVCPAISCKEGLTIEMDQYLVDIESVEVGGPNLKTEVGEQGLQTNQQPQKPPTVYPRHPTTVSGSLKQPARLGLGLQRRPGLPLSLRGSRPTVRKVGERHATGVSVPRESPTNKDVNDSPIVLQAPASSAGVGKFSTLVGGDGIPGQPSASYHGQSGHSEACVPSCDSPTSFSGGGVTVSPCAPAGTAGTKAPKRRSDSELLSLLGGSPTTIPTPTSSYPSFHSDRLIPKPSPSSVSSASACAGTDHGSNMDRQVASSSTLTDLGKPGIHRSKLSRPFASLHPRRNPPLAGVVLADTAELSQSNEIPLSSERAHHITGSTLSNSFTNRKARLDKLVFDCGRQNPVREVEVPDFFSKPVDYVKCFTDAIREDINLQIYFRVRKPLQEALAACTEHNKEIFLRKHGIQYYESCELILSRPRTGNPFSKRFRGRANETYEADEECTEDYQWFLKIPPSSKASTSSYCRGDFWILSQHRGFDSQLGQFDLNDKVYFCQSSYFGVSKEGLLKVESLPASLASSLPTINSKTLKVSAILAFNPSGAFSVISELEAVVSSPFPLLPCLLSPDTAPITSMGDFDKFRVRGNENNDIIDAVVREIAAERFSLNSYQHDVLKHCSGWFSTSSDRQHTARSPSVCLVHGVFGSGKSHTIVALILLLVRLGRLTRTKPRILLAALTNVAVDRVLLELQKEDYHDFVRVGSLRKIAKPLLKHTVSEMSSRGSTDNLELTELRSMLKEASGEDALCIRSAISDVEKGMSRKRRQNLSKAVVVGVTIAATAFPILQGSVFDIVILDECSQMTEPSSLLPLCRFRAARVVAVGDPLQLPPILETGLPPASSGGVTESQGLGKPMFTRLLTVGHRAIMLRTQYRLHPAISSLPNKLFYENKLVDGVNAEDRLPLVGSLPPLLCVDTGISGQERVTAGGGISNDYEATLVCRCVREFIDHGVCPSRIGVIVLYRAQRYAILRRLQDEAAGAAESVTVSTVDAFQGAERDVILISTCRTSYTTSFLESRERTNVALTRARHHLLLFARVQTLQQSSLWKDVLDCMEQQQPGRWCVPSAQVMLGGLSGLHARNNSLATLQSDSNPPMPAKHTNQHLMADLVDVCGEKDICTLADAKDSLMLEDEDLLRLDDEERYLEEAALCVPGSVVHADNGTVSSLRDITGPLATDTAFPTHYVGATTDTPFSVGHGASGAVSVLRASSGACVIDPSSVSNVDHASLDPPHDHASLATPQDAVAAHNKCSGLQPVRSDSIGNGSSDRAAVPPQDGSLPQVCIESSSDGGCMEVGSQRNEDAATACSSVTVGSGADSSLANGFRGAKSGSDRTSGAGGRMISEISCTENPISRIASDPPGEGPFKDPTDKESEKGHVDILAEFFDDDDIE